MLLYSVPLEEVEAGTFMLYECVPYLEGKVWVHTKDDVYHMTLECLD